MPPAPSRVRLDQPLLPSVLDRLIDLDPATSVEPPQSRTQMLRELRASVRRDLELLLNSRQRFAEVPAEYGEAAKSLLTYGLADFSGAGPSGAKERAELCRKIEGVIRRNEPRLLSVKVDLITDGDPTDRTLRFRIDALMRADPAPEPVVFDTVMEPTTTTFTVGGEAG